MTESASHKAKEASKGLQQDLKDALRTRDPWEREIEFQRKELRRKYLLLLLVFPHTRESKDVETHLWMQTSYQFISEYKQRVAKLDRTLQSAPRQQARHSNTGPVEYRKLMQRFRQFLAEEEKFWIQLVSRYCRSFALDEASPALAALGIQSDPVDVAGANPSDSPERDVAQNTRNGRHNSLFPSEENIPPAPPLDSTERENRLSILSKTLVCLGDIARYRELYNEGGGRPKAGHEDGPAPARKSRNRRGGVPGLESIPRARTYDRSQQCYEQARLLVPHEGNASHQLAILAFYQKDMFGSLIHYYKALCVRQPYDTASENMASMLYKLLETWKTRKKAKDEDDRNEPPRIRVDNLKEKILVLHALWRFGADKVGPMPPDFANIVVRDFAGVVSDRVLPTDIISKVIVLSQGALWKHRMIRDSPGSSKNSTISTDSPIAVESDIATHILALYRTLLEIGIVELAVAPPEDADENDLAQRITAIFRRTLPALRMASKWLTANLKYVMQAQSPANDKGDFRVNNTRTSSSALSISDIPSFWTAYAKFYNVLHRSFPLDKLPSLSIPLEEDIDMKGFLPLRRLMAGEMKNVDGGGQKDKSVANGVSPQGREKQVHPNEEQLMRIWDLLQDVKAVVACEVSPISLRDGFFKYVGGHQRGADAGAALVLSTERHEMRISPILESKLFPTQVFDNDRQHIEQDEDAMTEVTRTDDDPVDEAFRKVLNGSDTGITEDLEDEDRIIWDVGAPSGNFGKHPTSPSLMSPRTPVRPPANLSPPISAVIPAAVSPAAVFQGTTAQDLLNNVMGKPRGNLETSRSQYHKSPVSTVPQSRLLGHSIWSMTPNSTTGFGAVGSHNFARHSPSQSTSQMPSRHAWASSFESTPNSQIPLPGVSSSTSFAPQPYLSLSPGHHRSYSTTSSVPRHSASHTVDQESPSLSSGLAQHFSHRSHDLPPVFTDPAIVSSGRPGPTNLQGGLHDYHYQNHNLPYPIGHSHGLRPISHSWANNG